ncbi:putative ankyrin repeat-containing domain-containing protein [Helianthus annuus]|nr:putative ankyrin repeat-containing domain-containing protein [Helianthus annuus]
MEDWDTAEQIFLEDNDALINKLNIDGCRTLHIAIGNPNNIMILQNLLERINPESLPTLVNNKQQNALHYAAILDNTKAAKMLVEKNPRLLFAVDYQKYLPIQKAIFNSHKATFDYLLGACKQYIGLSKKHGYPDPFKGEKGVSLLDNIILSGFLGELLNILLKWIHINPKFILALYILHADDAYRLLQDYPELARTKVASFKAPLWCIAQKWDAYPSAEKYNSYQRFIYSRMSFHAPNFLSFPCEMCHVFY